MDSKSNQLIKNLQKFLDKQTAEDNFSGAVLVTQGNETIFEFVSGLAHKGFQISNKIDTKFNIGSLGKMFTAVAIAQLAEKGLLSFEDKIGEFLPDYPNQAVKDKVTIHQMLTHTSGLGTIFNQNYPNSRWKLRTLSDWVELFKNDPLQFEPGSKWQYSNASFVLLGRIVEVLSGQSYFDFVKSNIFNVAEMPNTDYFELDHDTPNLAYGYTYRKPFSQEMEFDKPRHNNLIDLFIKGVSGGGEYSNVYDMLNFAKALKDYKLMSQEMTQKVLSFKVETGKSFLKYAYAFYIMEMEGHILIGREGGYAGMSSMFHLYQDVDYMIIILSNYDDPAAKDVAKEFAKLLPQ